MVDVNKLERRHLEDRVMSYYALPFDHVHKMEEPYLRTLLRVIYEKNVGFALNNFGIMAQSKEAARKGLV